MLRKLSKEQITEDQRLHNMWLRNEPGGKCIDWSGADLTGADLSNGSITVEKLAPAVVDLINNSVGFATTVIDCGNFEDSSIILEFDCGTF